MSLPVFPKLNFIEFNNEELFPNLPTIKPFEMPVSVEKTDEDDLVKFEEERDLKQEANSIAHKLYLDITAVTSAGFLTTGKDFKKHLSEIDKENIKLVLDKYKDCFGKSLEEAINGEWGLKKRQKDEFISYLERVFEEAENYKSKFETDSKIKNEFYEGASYHISQNGNAIIITNKNTREITILDLRKLCEKLPIEHRVALKKALQSLPAEVLIDISKEAEFAANKKAGSIRDYYSYFFDKIFLADQFPRFNEDERKYAVLHEMGHAIDFIEPLIIPSGFLNSDFMKNYNEELKIYKEAGHEQYQERFGKRISGEDDSYPTRNGAEMFAECYVLLMTGDNYCKRLIERYFPKTLQSAKEHLAYIRSLNNYN